jgi:S-DNA-T family DNA segregation ATPase FtsK/SpoIIIE
VPKPSPTVKPQEAAGEAGDIIFDDLAEAPDLSSRDIDLHDDENDGPADDVSKAAAPAENPAPASPASPPAGARPVAAALVDDTSSRADDDEAGEDGDGTEAPPLSRPQAEAAAVAAAVIPPQPPPTATKPEPLPGMPPTVKPPRAEDRAPKPQARPSWEMPSVSLLQPAVRKSISDEELRRRAEIIEQTLSSFGAPGRVVEVNHGPVITQFGVEPDYIDGRSGKRIKVKVGKISALADDLALALAAPSIRIEAPVPGKGFVGIEVPNAEPSIVGLRDAMDTPEFTKLDSPLKLALGQDVSGQPVVADLTAMPHLLIAGTTGSGKSVCVNGIVTTMLMTCSPDHLKMIMVDPKRVELTNYNGIPHLMAPVVTELERIVGVLKWVQREMDDRYRKFAMAGARNITDYNGRIEKGKLDGERLPYIIVIVDELADLMMLAPDETERVITRLAQMARATGIHIIISTQRPSVDVVTGLIKANFPARIAFAVATGVDSRVILDMPGAEKLLGRGDMLFQAPETPLPIRMQGVYVSDEEIQRVADFWRKQGASMPSSPAPGMPGFKATPGTAPLSAPPRRVNFEDDEEELDEGDNDDLFEEAVELVRDMEKASISLLQRHLRIGYTRAARLIDLMEERGVIGPHEGGSKPREVLGSEAGEEQDDDDE